MKNKILILLALTIVLLVTVVGCKGADNSLEGKNIVTFELAGGTLKYSTSSTKTKINFAYYPGTYIIAPQDIYGYELSRSGYDFTGWYTSPDCLPGELWDFDTPFNMETLTLYAGWKESISYTYTLYYTDENGETIALDSYLVEAGDTFSDWRNFAKKRTGYTPVAFFSDKELNTPWDTSFTHPGGAEDLDIAVYVSYIEGDWNLVANYAQFISAINNNKNIYLTADIDGEGAEFYNKNFSALIEGNGFNVSNLNVVKTGTIRYYCSMFATLGEGAAIKNVNFTNITFILDEVNEGVANNGINIAALARNANGATIENVTVAGQVVTEYTGELPRLNEALYDSTSTATINNFTANIEIVTP